MYLHIIQFRIIPWIIFSVSNNVTNTTKSEGPVISTSLLDPSISHSISSINEIIVEEQHNKFGGDDTVCESEVPPNYFPHNSSLVNKNNERVIMDVDSLVSFAERVASHSKCCSGVDYGVANRSWVNLDVKCKKCNETFVIRKDNPTNHQLPLNEALAVGSYCGGFGYSGARYLLGTAEIDVIDKKTFQHAEEEIGKRIATAIKDNFHKNIETEKNLAIERGDILNIDGKEIPFITVVVDGSWAKRSYGHGYNSNAGSAVIIGARTNKILWLGSKIKTCCICDKKSDSDTIKPHDCFKNW